MTEIKSTSSIGSDGSLVLIEAVDAIPTAVVTEEDVPPPSPTAPSGDESPNAAAVAETYSYNSEESAEQQQQQEQSQQEDEPLIATTVQVVDDVPSATMSVSMSTIPSTVGGDDDIEDDIGERERKVGAGIAIGILTAPFCGPVLAVVAGVAAAYGTSQPGAAGDACRAAGEIAVVAKEKAIEVDRKHDLVNKTKESASQLVDKARDQNERQRIFEKVKEVMACTLKNVAAALQFAAEKVKESSSKNKNKSGNKASSSSTTDVKEAFSYEKVSMKTEGN